MYTRPLKPRSPLAPALAPVAPVARAAPPAPADARDAGTVPGAPPRTVPAGRAGMYSQVAQDSAVIGASAPQLITLLFDGARQAIALARHHMARGEVAAKGRAISRAVGIVGHGLKAGLDARAGGEQGAELVQQLEPLYDYICQRLVLANLRNDPQLLDEAERLLEAVGSAWRVVAAPGGVTGPQP